MEKMQGKSGDGVSRTALWMAAARAAEHGREDRLFADPLAAEFVGGPVQAKAGTQAGDNTAYTSIRTRLFDDRLLMAVQDRGIGQVVILGAGYDGRAFRLDWPEDLRLYEVDCPAVVEHKEAVLNRLGAKPRCRRSVVAADLAGRWQEGLWQAGFEAERPAAFLLEGVLMYLPPEAATGVLREISAVAAGGSWLGADLITPEVLVSPFTRPMLERLEQQGCPWRYGEADPKGRLAVMGWQAEVIMPGEAEANFGRWPHRVPPRFDGRFPIMYFVTAMRSQ